MTIIVKTVGVRTFPQLPCKDIPNLVRLLSLIISPNSTRDTQLPSRIKPWSPRKKPCQAPFPYLPRRTPCVPSCLAVAWLWLSLFWAVTRLSCLEGRPRPGPMPLRLFLLLSELRPQGELEWVEKEGVQTSNRSAQRCWGWKLALIIQKICDIIFVCHIMLWYKVLTSVFYMACLWPNRNFVTFYYRAGWHRRGTTISTSPVRSPRGSGFVEYA